MNKFAMSLMCITSFLSAATLADQAQSSNSVANKPQTTKPTANNNQVASENNAQSIEIVTRPEIVGLWGMEIPNNKSCVEFYNFRNANEVLINSGKEWSFAQYEYQPSLNAPEKLAALAMQIRFDNNQLDCSGHQQDQTGEVAQYFVHWKNPNHIQFCGSEKADKCVANLHRILP